MQPTDIDLFDIDASNILSGRRHLQMDRNAFLLCTAGSVALDMDNRRYTLHPGDIFLYSAFAHTTVALRRSAIRSTSYRYACSRRFR